MLSTDEHKELLDALHAWAEKVPDAPAMGFLGKQQLLTAKELVDAVEADTEDGAAFIEILEHGVRQEGIKGVTERFFGHR